jgi:hypothetical protein
MHQTELIRRIREVHTQIAWLAPARDLGLIPNPRASAIALSRVEARIKRPLPPSYRQFLQLHDGWPRFFEGATLLGTATLGHRRYEDLARVVFEAAETPVPEVGPPSRPRTRTLIPFGADLEGSTLFAFDPQVRRADGEYEVIAWVNELGVRLESFAGFLEFVLELAEAELAHLTSGGADQAIAAAG